MLTRQEAIDACMALAGVYEDYPFDDVNWTCMRHSANKRIFALIFEREGRVWISVKNEPSWGDFWRSGYPSVVPAYHMNKLHWSSIILDGSVEDEVISKMIADSYDLTAPKRKKQYKDEF